ncbi:Hypothetical predicted protein [Octopus vulgaris]|uniref:Uncharacterized protein n=1 Tax=Octopus vulgaris TaxID=6645 RepID=A0AA36ANC5_OCTVU|nr:Hypothetical predicted protein [Octopus vulgaris]
MGRRRNVLADTNDETSEMEVFGTFQKIRDLNEQIAIRDRSGIYRNYEWERNNFTGGDYFILESLFVIRSSYFVI